MKLKNIFLPLAAASLLVTGCYDEKMDWHTPADHGAVVSSDIPLQLAEKIANYDYIKTYTTQYMPGVQFGLGIGADKYLSDEAYAAVAEQNFLIFTPGNAMKHQSAVNNDGSLKVGPGSLIEQFVTKANDAGIEIFGHNFIWHTQQQQNYLKSLIAPTMQVESEGGIANVLTGDSHDFEGGTTGGWGSWGSNKESAEVVAGAGKDGSYGLVLTNKGDGNYWEAQNAYTFNEFLKKDVTYVIKFDAKSSSPAGHLQFQYQNSTSYGSQGCYAEFEVGTDWVTCEKEFTITDYDDVDRIIINFGKYGGTYYIDNIEFGEKVEDPMDNVLTGDASDFEGGTTGGWGSWGSNKESADVVEGEGYNGSYGLVLTNKGDGNYWEAQNAYTFNDFLKKDQPYIIQFKAKSSTPTGHLQFQYQNSTSYGSQGCYAEFEVGTDWVTCEKEFTITDYDDVDRIIINFGKYGGTYYIDDIKFGPKRAAAGKPALGASKVTYVFKTPEEKREALLGAMEQWIKGMAEACPTVKQWDVINEPITDGYDGYAWRGLNGKFGMYDGDDADREPVEDPESGLSLNWMDGHWYWGYYIGEDYGAQAFNLAHQYLGSQAKLYVNEYGLETSPEKLASLLKFIEKIDELGGQVDGIGTQMHVTYNQITREQVDQMFRTLAATGKLVRVSELDVAMGTATPSAEQQQQQSDVYQMIIESYKENVPEAQRGGFCIWTLSDAADEHEYWLKDDAPNLFDKNYARKIAYKGVCDGIAGKDISEDFTGDMWTK